MYQYDEGFVETAEEKAAVLGNCFAVMLSEEATSLLSQRNRRVPADDGDTPSRDRQHQEFMTPLQLLFLMRTIDPIAQTRTTVEELQAIIAAELLMPPEQTASGQLSIFEAAQEFVKQEAERVIGFADLCVLFESKPVNPNAPDMLRHSLTYLGEIEKSLRATEKEEQLARQAIAKIEADESAQFGSQLRRAVHITKLRQQLSTSFQHGKRILDAEAQSKASQADAERLRDLKSEQRRVKDEGKAYIEAVTALEAQAAKVEEDMNTYHQQIQVLGKWKETGIQLCTAEIEGEWSSFFKTLANRYDERNEQLARLEEKLTLVGQNMMRQSLERGHEAHRAALKEYKRAAQEKVQRGDPLFACLAQDQQLGLDFEWVADGPIRSSTDQSAARKKPADLRTTPASSSLRHATPQPQLSMQKPSEKGVDPWLLSADPVEDRSNLILDDEADSAFFKEAADYLLELANPFFKAISIDGDGDEGGKGTGKHIPCMTYGMFKAFIGATRTDVPGSLAITFLDDSDCQCIPLALPGAGASDSTSLSVNSADQRHWDPLAHHNMSAARFSPSGMLAAGENPAPRDREQRGTTKTETTPERGLTPKGLAKLLLGLAKLQYGAAHRTVSDAFLLRRFLATSIQPALARTSPAPQTPTGMASVAFASAAAAQDGIYGAILELAALEIPPSRFETMGKRYTLLAPVVLPSSEDVVAEPSGAASKIRRCLDATELIWKRRSHSASALHQTGVDDEGKGSMYCIVSSADVIRRQPLFSELLTLLSSMPANKSDAPLGALAEWCRVGYPEGSQSLMEQRLLSSVIDVLQQSIARTDGRATEPLLDYWGIEATFLGSMDKAGMPVPFLLFLAALPSLCRRPPLPPLGAFLRALCPPEVTGRSA
jgi:hypothetical protein